MESPRGFLRCLANGTRRNNDGQVNLVQELSELGDLVLHILSVHHKIDLDLPDNLP